MKAKPYKYIETPGRSGAGRSSVPCEVEEADYVELNMPGPLSYRHIPVILSGSRRDHKGPVWSWNGDVDKPTLKPSILSRSSITCHSFVNDGRVQFLSDCQHEFAGQTLDLLEVEE